MGNSIKRIYIGGAGQESFPVKTIMTALKQNFFFLEWDMIATYQNTIVKTIHMEGMYKKTASVVRRITFTN